MNKKKKALIGIGVGVAALAMFGAGCYVGKRYFIDKLIDLEMAERNVKPEFPVYKHSTKKYGGLIFEIKPECIGD